MPDADNTTGPATTEVVAAGEVTTALATEPPRSALEEFMAEMGGDKPMGLESVTGDDVALPIFRIDHETGKFVDSLSGATYDELDCVLLGLLKQRVMWDADLNTGTGPMCKSRDGNTGNPRENFPWGDFSAAGGIEAVGSEAVTCATCPFEKWGSNPKNDTPWCTAQYVFPVVLGNDDRISGLLTLQRSAIKPTQRYITSFVRDGIPFFAYQTKIILESNKNGSVRFSTPKFTRGEAITDVNKFRTWAKQYQSIRDSVHSTDLTGNQDVVVTPPVADEGVGAIEAVAAEPAF